MKSQTDWTLSDGTPVKQTDLAKILHIEARDVRRQVAKMPTHCKTNLRDALEWYFQKDLVVTDEEGQTVKFDDLKQERLFHEVRKLRHDANRSAVNEEKERHSFDAEKGLFVERQTVEHRIADISKQLSDRLFAMPNRVSSLMMQAKSEAEVKHILNAELRKITADIDQMEVFE